MALKQRPKWSLEKTYIQLYGSIYFTWIKLKKCISILHFFCLWISPDRRKSITFPSSWNLNIVVCGPWKKNCFIPLQNGKDLSKRLCCQTALSKSLRCPPRLPVSKHTYSNLWSCWTCTLTVGNPKRVLAQWTLALLVKSEQSALV